ncbi:hypothetical protein KC976_02615 [Candidatus Saccharibacteria bacterium]|nr:hypothetical protein [Candidatus Saccharibacteria bacterium]
MQKQKHHHKLKKVIQVREASKPRFIDRATYFAAIVEPLLTLPQAYQVFSTKSAHDINILSWIGFEIMALVWIWYAIVHRERIVFIYQVLFFIIDGSVLAGAILYGGRWL